VLPGANRTAYAPDSIRCSRGGRSEHIPAAAAPDAIIFRQGNIVEITALVPRLSK
jgi:hypothetical protein